MRSRATDHAADTVTVTLAGAEATRGAGLALGRGLPRRAIVLLGGGLGAGKTTLAKAVCEALGIAPRVVISPTYTLVNVYPGSVPVYHVDLFRMEDADGLLELDRDDWVNPDGPTLIEWPALARPLLAGEALLEVALAMETATPHRRTLTVRGDPAAYGAALEALRAWAGGPGAGPHDPDDER